MGDCVSCGKKLLEAAEELAELSERFNEPMKSATQRRAEYYIDAINIVCPERAELRRTQQERKS